MPEPCRHQRLGVADVIENPEQFQRFAARHRCRNAGEPTSPACNAPEAIALITSPPPPNCFQVDLQPVAAAGRASLRHAIRHHHVLITDGHLFRLREDRCRNKRCDRAGKQSTIHGQCPLEEVKQSSDRRAMPAANLFG
jgi:hypothetical protein